MNLLTLIPLLTFAFGMNIIRPGTMFISKINSEPTYQLLKLDNGKVVTGDERFYFRFDVAGTLKAYRSGRYLGFSDKGHLIGSDTPQLGFTMTTIEGTQWNRSVAFEGDVDFQLCGDNSIAYKSNCAGARPITITYRDALQPRNVIQVVKK